jgi:hypothetical protein
MDNLSYHDITPKSGLAYDLFGNGRTALKVSLNKYLTGYGTAGLAANPNPILNQVTSATRVWTDVDRDYVPDCDLLNPEPNGECLRLSNSNFGLIAQPDTTFADDILRGWNARDFNWEFSTGVQHELVPRVSVDMSYFRRWYGNFRATDNRSVSPGDYDTYSITVPVDSRLPNGGGYTISGLYDLNPAKFGRPEENLQTLARNYAKRTEHHDSVSVNVNARMRSGVTAAGGVAFHKETTDNCELVALLDNPSPLYCHTETPFRANIKGLASYQIPRIAVQVSATYQNQQGALLSANLVVPNAQIAPSLGRNLSGSTNATVQIIEPGTRYGDRLNQLDLRIGKIVRFSQRRATVNLDVYNATNSATVMTYSNQYASLWRPQSLLQARFVKISAQLDF